MVITKKYYVIYSSKTILMMGDSTGLYIHANADCVEFDTEAEMLQYIEESELITQEEIGNETY